MGSERIQFGMTFDVCNLGLYVHFDVMFDAFLLNNVQSIPLPMRVRMYQNNSYIFSAETDNQTTK